MNFIKNWVKYGPFVQGTQSWRETINLEGYIATYKTFGNRWVVSLSKRINTKFYRLNQTVLPFGGMQGCLNGNSTVGSHYKGEVWHDLLHQ